jgi:hypothetical protein
LASNDQEIANLVQRNLKILDRRIRAKLAGAEPTEDLEESLRKEDFGGRGLRVLPREVRSASRLSSAGV